MLLDMPGHPTLCCAEGASSGQCRAQSGFATMPFRTCMPLFTCMPLCLQGNSVGLAVAEQGTLTMQRMEVSVRVPEHWGEMQCGDDVMGRQ